MSTTSNKDSTNDTPSGNPILGEGQSAIQTGIEHTSKVV